MVNPAPKSLADDRLAELLRLGIDCNVAAATRIDADKATIEMLCQREANTTHRADARLHEAEARIVELEKLLARANRTRKLFTANDRTLKSEFYL